MGLEVVLGDLAQHAVRLQRELARRGDDEHARAVARLELGLDEELYGGDEEGQRLAAARLGLPDDVAPCERAITIESTHIR